MALRIGDTAPDFQAQTTEGTIEFHQWIGNSWAILFSHPKDFTPVCTTELGYMARIKDEFDRRNTKIIGLSADSVEEHRRWAKDIEETQGSAVNYPMIGDQDLKVAKLYDMLPAEAVPGKRTPAENATVRTVFMIGCRIPASRRPCPEAAPTVGANSNGRAARSRAWRRDAGRAPPRARQAKAVRCWRKCAGSCPQRERARGRDAHRRRMLPADGGLEAALQREVDPVDGRQPVTSGLSAQPGARVRR
jgi:alkyl hydroperoxide reductase subunit AhpC